MTIAEALKFAEEMQSKLSYRLECAQKVPARSYYEKQDEMLIRAIAALREQEERQNPKTNADRIRAMSEDELAEAIYQGISSDACDYCKENDHHCTGHSCQGKATAEIIREWLQQPAEDGGAENAK